MDDMQNYMYNYLEAPKIKNFRFDLERVQEDDIEHTVNQFICLNVRKLIDVKVTTIQTDVAKNVADVLYTVIYIPNKD